MLRVAVDDSGERTNRCGQHLGQSFVLAGIVQMVGQTSRHADAGLLGRKDAKIASLDT